MSRGANHKTRQSAQETNDGSAAPPPSLSPLPATKGSLTTGAMQTPIWAFASGGLLSLALLKLGNPVILGDKVEAPRGVQEWLFFAWPPDYGIVPLALVLIGAGSLWKGARNCPRWWAWMGMGWLAWQAVVAWRVPVPGSGGVLTHYVTLLGCGGCGCILARLPSRHGRWFWLALTIGFVWVLFEGFRQHYGGLEATRQFIYEQADWQQYNPDFLKRLARDRVFSTLFYANALAGVVILLLPALVWVCWHAWPEALRLFRSVTTGLLAYAGLACLFWSGSKAGWLIALLVGALAALQVTVFRPPGRSLRPGHERGMFPKLGPLSPSGRWQLALILMGITGGLVIFGIRFQDYFQRGATSAVARLDYWTVAAQNVVEHPVLGGGLGSFEHLYRQKKKPEAEMSRLVHNDYLQQASDSGILGGVLFTGWIWGGLGWTYRFGRRKGLPWMVWLGLFGWAVQELVEFGIFIPAVAWPAMLLLGWLIVATQSEMPGLPMQTQMGKSDS